MHILPIVEVYHHSGSGAYFLVTTMSKYTEQFKDPRWQKKRLEIMERDNFTCQMCGSKVKTLNVHHILYVPNRSPWDYLDEMLVTICEEDHESIKSSENRDFMFLYQRSIAGICSDYRMNLFHIGYLDV